VELILNRSEGLEVRRVFEPELKFAATEAASGKFDVE